MFRVLPTAILDRAYDVVARNRYRVFGRYDNAWFRGRRSEAASSSDVGRRNPSAQRRRTIFRTADPLPHF